MSSSKSSSLAPQGDNCPKTPLQIAQANVRAASLKHLEIRFQNWVQGQLKYSLHKDIMESLDAEGKALLAKYKKQLQDDDLAGSEETKKEAEKVTEKLRALDDAIMAAIGEKNLKEEADADDAVFFAFKEVWTLKGYPS